MKVRFRLSLWSLDKMAEILQTIYSNTISWKEDPYVDSNFTHYNDVIMRAMTSQITSLTIVYSTVYSGAVQRKHQSSASPAFVRRTHRWPVNSPHKGPVTRQMFPFDNVIMEVYFQGCAWHQVSKRSGNALMVNRRNANTWTNDHVIHAHTYASPGINELTPNVTTA